MDRHSQAHRQHTRGSNQSMAKHLRQGHPRGKRRTEQADGIPDLATAAVWTQFLTIPLNKPMSHKPGVRPIALQEGRDQDRRECEELLTALKPSGPGNPTLDPARSHVRQRHSTGPRRRPTTTIHDSFQREDPQALPYLLCAWQTARLRFWVKETQGWESRFSSRRSTADDHPRPPLPGEQWTAHRTGHPTRVQDSLHCGAQSPTAR